MRIQLFLTWAMSPCCEQPLCNTHVLSTYAFNVGESARSIICMPVCRSYSNITGKVQLLQDSGEQATMLGYCQGSAVIVLVLAQQ